jgi:ribosomal protein S6
LNKYEGLFIFPESLKPEALDEVLGQVRTDIDKQGGRVEHVIRMGKRPFARRLKKSDAGHYAVVNFSLPGAKLSALRARFALNEQVFRAQIVRVKEHTAPAAAGETREDTAHATA